MPRACRTAITEDLSGLLVRTVESSRIVLLDHARRRVSES